LSVGGWVGFAGAAGGGVAGGGVGGVGAGVHPARLAISMTATSRTISFP